MQLVCDSFAFKVEHRSEGAATLLINPVEVVDGDVIGVGIPLVIAFSEDKKEALIGQLEAGRQVKPADNAALHRATRGLAVPPVKRGRSA